MLRNFTSTRYKSTEARFPDAHYKDFVSAAPGVISHAHNRIRSHDIYSIDLAESS